MKRTLLFTNYEQRLSVYVDDEATKIDGLLSLHPLLINDTFRSILQIPHDRSSLL